jgi:hypothetical protein
MSQWPADPKATSRSSKRGTQTTSRSGTTNSSSSSISGSSTGVSANSRMALLATLQRAVGDHERKHGSIEKG